MKVSLGVVSNMSAKAYEGSYLIPFVELFEGEFPGMYACYPEDE